MLAADTVISRQYTKVRSCTSISRNSLLHKLGWLKSMNALIFAVCRGTKNKVE